jgi:hypothetical protein
MCADFAALDLTHWDFSQPPVLVDAVSASANADASSATVLVDLLVLAVSASANADASAATVLAGPGICRAAAQSASARYQASPAGVVQQGAEITTLWARVQTTTLLQGIMATSLHGPEVQTTTLVSAGTSTTLLGSPGVMTMLAGMPASTTLYSTPQAL